MPSVPDRRKKPNSLGGLKTVASNMLLGGQLFTTNIYLYIYKRHPNRKKI